MEGEFKYLRISQKGSNDLTESDVLAFQKLDDEKINRFGINKHTREHLRLESKLATAQNKFIITRDRKQNNAIRYYKSEIKKCEDKMKGGLTPSKVLIRLSEKLAGGRQINPKEITAGYYYEMIEEYERSN